MVFYVLQHAQLVYVFVQVKSLWLFYVNVSKFSNVHPFITFKSTAMFAVIVSYATDGHKVHLFSSGFIIHICFRAKLYRYSSSKVWASEPKAVLVN
jgi:hypothetical protein